MRRDYKSLLHSSVKNAQDPYELFATWFAAARRHRTIKEPNAMHLATVDERNHPTARMVLLKGLAEGRFVFYTNYESDKGRHLCANPRAALLFWWEPLARQVRITGRVQKLKAKESDEYFASRPRDSQLAARVSPQSQVIEGYEVLTQELGRQREKFADRPIPRPAQWGGFALTPKAIEFWQGGPQRLHLRLLFRRSPKGWRREWLAP